MQSLRRRVWATRFFENSVPDAFDAHFFNGLLEVEQRITRASQAELERQRDAIQGQLAGLPDAVRKARDHFIHCRAAMAEIELHEQLMPVMNALARASAARRQINYHHDESRFPVEIPRDLIEAASDALAAEMPAA